MTLILIAAEVLLIAVTVRLLRRPGVSIALATCLACYVAMWHVVPTVISIGFWNSLARVPLVEFDAFARMAALDAITLALGLFLLSVGRPYFSRFTRSEMASVSVGPVLALLVVAFGMVLDWYTLAGYGDTLGATYAERNAFQVTGEETAAFRSIGALSFGHVFLTGFAFAAVMKTWPPRPASYLLRGAVGLWLGLITLQGLLEGSRISGLMPLLVLVLIGVSQRWSIARFGTRVGAACAITLVAGGSAVIVIGEYRAGQGMTGRDIAAGSFDLLHTSRSASDFGTSLLGEAVTKFDAFSTGALLLERLGVGTGGWRPYEGALLSLVPRQLLESKPVPGSADGTYAGHPSRMVAYAAGMAYESGNVNVSPAAIAIWQIGYAGLALLALSNALYWRVLNSLLLAPGLVPRALGLSAIGLPTFLTLFATPDAVLLMLERLVALCVIVLAAMVSIARLGRDSGSGRIGEPPQGALPSLAHNV
jgi:hypothetical protein